VAGGWRRLHNEELHNVHATPDIIRGIKSRRMRLTGHVARMSETRNSYSILVAKPEGKKRFGRLRRRWEDNVTVIKVKLSLRLTEHKVMKAYWGAEV